MNINAWENAIRSKASLQDTAEKNYDKALVEVLNELVDLGCDIRSVMIDLATKAKENIEKLEHQMKNLNYHG